MVCILGKKLCNTDGSIRAVAWEDSASRATLITRCVFPEIYGYPPRSSSNGSSQTGDKSKQAWCPLRHTWQDSGGLIGWDWPYEDRGEEHSKSCLPFKLLLHRSPHGYLYARLRYSDFDVGNSDIQGCTVVLTEEKLVLLNKANMTLNLIFIWNLNWTVVYQNYRRNCRKCEMAAWGTKTWDIFVENGPGFSNGSRS